MGVQTWYSVLGAQYQLHHEERLLLGAYSDAQYLWDDETVQLHSCTTETSFATVTGVFQTKFEEELTLGSGQLLIGFYDSIDEELGIILATNTIAFWTSGGAAMWTDVGSKGFDWAIELMSALQPTVSEGMAHATAAEPGRENLVNDEVLVTIFPPQLQEAPPDKVLGLNPRESSPAPSRPGQPTRAGELFLRSHGADRPRQAVLRTSSALVTVSEAGFGSEGARTFLEGFLDVKRNPPR